MVTKEYTLLATSGDPTFDMSDANLDGGDHLITVAAEDDSGKSEYSKMAVYSQEHPEYVIKRSTLTAIADSVRAKTGKTNLIPTDDISSEIDSLVAGGMKIPTDTKDIISNDEYDVTNYAKVNVNVPVPTGYYQPMDSAKQITTNNTFVSTYSDSGRFYPSVNVQIPLEEKIIEADGEYYPSDGYEGISKVTVSVKGTYTMYSIDDCLVFNSTINPNIISDSWGSRHCLAFYLLGSNDNTESIPCIGFHSDEGFLKVIKDDGSEMTIYNSISNNGYALGWLIPEEMRRICFRYNETMLYSLDPFKKWLDANTTCKKMVWGEKTK